MTNSASSSSVVPHRAARYAPDRPAACPRAAGRVVPAIDPPISSGSQNRTDSGGPETVAGAIPAMPALEAGIQQAGRVAVQRLQAQALRLGRRPAFVRLMAGLAGDIPARRQARLAEQHGTETDGVGIAGQAVGAIRLRRGRPGAMALDSGLSARIERMVHPMPSPYRRRAAGKRNQQPDHCAL